MNLKEYNLVQRADELMEQGAFDKALTRLEICIEEEPENADLRNSAGFCFSKLGQHNQALGHFKEAVKKSGGKHSYQTNLGLCLMYLGQYEDALPVFQKALRADHLNPAYMAYLSNCEAKLGKKSAEGNLKTAFTFAKEKDYGDDHPVMKTIRSIAEEYKFAL